MLLAPLKIENRYLIIIEFLKGCEAVTCYASFRLLAVVMRGCGEKGRHETRLPRFVGPIFFLHMGRRRPKRLAEKLLQIRETLGLSQRELAAQLGNYRTHHHISKYECGKSVPPLEVVLAYSRVANITMNQIVDDDIDLPPLGVKL
jgi:DNA-binding XRE family transcriptional regulator